MAGPEDLADDVRMAADAQADEWESAAYHIKQIVGNADEVGLKPSQELRAFERSIEAAKANLDRLVAQMRSHGKSPYR